MTERGSIFRSELFSFGSTAPARPQGPPGGEVGTVRFQLQYEDLTPMADAEVEVDAGSETIRGRSDASGIVSLDLPIEASEPYRVFLLSYPSTFSGRDAPPPPPVELRPEPVVLFGFDSSFPAAGVLPRLARVHAALDAAPVTRLLVAGHTDPAGSDAYNLALSERRASAVLALLTRDAAMLDGVAAAESWDVAKYQAMLRAVGCNPGAIDADEGAMTRAAVEAFQREYNAGVFHPTGATRRLDSITVNGSLSQETKSALRDAYVHIADVLSPSRLTAPPLLTCGEANLVSSDNDYNRRSTIVFFEDGAPAGPPAASDYGTAVGETADDLHGPWFADFQWLRGNDGSAHLSAITGLPDGVAVRFTVYRAESAGGLPTESSSAGPRLTPGAEMATMDGTIRGGICFARWQPPAGFDPFDMDSWLVDQDVDPFVGESEEDGELPAGHPASVEALEAGGGVRPPVFAIDAAGQWGISGPPGIRLNRIHLTQPDEASGLALGSSGSFIEFRASAGRIAAAGDVDVSSLALRDMDLELESGEAIG